MATTLLWSIANVWMVENRKRMRVSVCVWEQSAQTQCDCGEFVSSKYISKHFITIIVDDDGSECTWIWTMPNITRQTSRQTVASWYTHTTRAHSDDGRPTLPNAKCIAIVCKTHFLWTFCLFEYRVYASSSSSIEMLLCTTWQTTIWMRSWKYCIAPYRTIVHV